MGSAFSFLSLKSLIVILVFKSAILAMGVDSKFLLYASGIFICYFYYGILQERITRGKYGEGENEEKFTYTLALVCSQCIVNYIYARIMLVTFMKAGADKTSSVHYASSALTYLLAMVCSNLALQWVGYPTQVVGKSCKPIPVMILGVLIGGKSYPMIKYLFILTIVLGVGMFMYKDNVASKTDSEESSIGFGEILLLLSLTMDGFTGEIFTFVGFVQRHPHVVWDILTFSIASALGQLFIYRMVAEYSALHCTLTTTTRKFFTVMASVLYFGNQLTPRQWIGSVLVFTGLTLDIFFGKKGAPKLH